MSSRYPDAIGIGFRRCASTWLHHYLNRHPDIGKTEDGLHYFSSNADKGHRWYSDQLRPFALRSVVLDLSVSYSYPEYVEAAASAMRSLVPEARLFASVRNPIDRAFSDYKRSIQRLELDATTSFEEAIERKPILLERGRYGRILAEYLQHFPREQLLVLFFSDLERRPEYYTTELLRFLGITNPLPPDYAAIDAGPAKMIRSQAYQSRVLGLKEFTDGIARRLGREDEWSDFKERHMAIYQKVLAWNHRDLDMQPALRRRLRVYYEDDIRIVESITKRSLSDWR